MTLKANVNPFASFDETLLSRAEALFNKGENLTEAIIHAHLLLEKGLELRISEKLIRREAVTTSKYSKWSFAHKVALFVALYAPAPETEKNLIGFNKLRNKVAHSFLERPELVYDYLTWDELSLHVDPIKHVIVSFALLAMMSEIRAIGQLERDDNHQQEGQQQEGQREGSGRTKL